MQLPATVATVLVHTAVYTTYLHLHCASLYVLNQKRKSGTSIANSLLTIVVSTILFILITAQWILTIVDTFTFLDAMRSLSFKDIASDSPMVYDGPHGNAKIALYIAQTVVGDGFFAYRLYLVYGQRWVPLIAPVFFILSFVALGTLNLLWGIVMSLLYPMFASTVIANVTITGTSISMPFIYKNFYTDKNDVSSSAGMITFKVWKANRNTTTFLDADHLRYSNPRPMALTWSVLYTLLESAGLYTLCVIATAIAPLLSSNWLSAFLSAIGPMIGIAFSLIILLVALGKTVERSDMTAPRLLVFRQSDVDANGVDQVNGDGGLYRRTEYGGEGEREVHDAGMGVGNGIQKNAMSPSSVVDV